MCRAGDDAEDLYRYLGQSGLLERSLEVSSSCTTTRSWISLGPNSASVSGPTCPSPFPRPLFRPRPSPSWIWSIVSSCRLTSAWLALTSAVNPVRLTSANRAIAHRHHRVCQPTPQSFQPPRILHVLTLSVSSYHICYTVPSPSSELGPKPCLVPCALHNSSQPSAASLAQIAHVSS